MKKRLICLPWNYLQVISAYHRNFFSRSRSYSPFSYDNYKLACREANAAYQAASREPWPNSKESRISRAISSSNNLGLLTASVISVLGYALSSAALAIFNYCLSGRRLELVTVCVDNFVLPSLASAVPLVLSLSFFFLMHRCVTARTAFYENDRARVGKALASQDRNPVASQPASFVSRLFDSILYPAALLAASAASAVMLLSGLAWGSVVLVCYFLRLLVLSVPVIACSANIVCTRLSSWALSVCFFAAFFVSLSPEVWCRLFFLCAVKFCSFPYCVFGPSVSATDSLSLLPATAADSRSVNSCTRSVSASAVAAGSASSGPSSSSKLLALSLFVVAAPVKDVVASSSEALGPLSFLLLGVSPLNLWLVAARARPFLSALSHVLLGQHTPNRPSHPNRLKILAPSYQIFVSAPSGPTITLDVDSSMTIAVLMVLVEVRLFQALFSIVGLLAL